MVEVDCILEIDAITGESPVWSPEERVLYWTDIPGKTFNRLDPETGANQSWPMPEELCSFARREGGGFIAAMRTGFAIFEPEARTPDFVERLLSPHAELRFNDGRCDPQGRYFAGTMDLTRTKNSGSLYRYSPGQVTEIVADGVMVANGLAWSPDGRTMYWSDTRGPVIYAFDYDGETGTPSDRRVFARPDERHGRPDGAAVDSEGYYWSAGFYGGCLTRYAPNGRVDGIIEFPVRDITMCAFGGDDLDTLYVTTSREALDEDGLNTYPLAGSLFACKPGVQGLPEPLFKG